MSDSPYTEGWPKGVFAGNRFHPTEIKVVPLSDAERLRGAAELAIRLADEGVIQDQIAERVRAALNPERD